MIQMPIVHCSKSFPSSKVVLMWIYLLNKSCRTTQSSKSYEFDVIKGALLETFLYFNHNRKYYDSKKDSSFYLFSNTPASRFIPITFSPYIFQLNIRIKFNVNNFVSIDSEKFNIKAFHSYNFNKPMKILYAFSSLHV